MQPVKTCAEVAAILGISRQCVHRIEQQAFRKLRYLLLEHRPSETSAVSQARSHETDR